MVHLLSSFTLIHGRAQAGLHPLPLDGHAQQICRTLQEGDVMLAEFALGPAVDLQHAERLAVALQDHVHGPTNTVHLQQVGRTEPLLVFEVVGDHRLAGAQGKAGR